MKVRRLFTLIAFVFSLGAGWLTLLPSVAQAAGENFKWVDPINITASGGRFKGTANFKGINNYNPNASINQYNGSITDSSGCTMTGTIQIKQGSPGSGTLFLNPNKAGSSTAPVCSQSIINQYPTTISVGNSGAATAAPPTKDDPKDENVNVIADPVSDIENTSEVSNAPKTDTITLKKDGKVIATKTANASAVAGRLNYSVTFANVAAGTYSVCSVVAANCANFTRQVQQIMPAVHIEGKNSNISAVASDNNADCDVGSFTWVVCPLILDVDKAISWTEDQMTKQLDVQSLASDGPLSTVWGNFRNLADVFLILIFFIVIFGTAVGMDNYTVKKILPRLIAAAILIQFSFLITQVAVDISNVLGQGIAILFSGIGGSTGNSSNSGMAILGGGEAALGAITALSLIVITPELMFTLLATLASAFLGLLAAFVTLELRQLMIDFLVILSPVAFILWVLPNTEKWFKRWREYLLDLLLMFPIIVILFQVANLFSRIVSTGGSDVSDGQKIIAALIPIIVFFLIPATFKLASKSLSTASGFINSKVNPARNKLTDNDFLKRKKEEGQKAGVERLQDLKASGAEKTFAGRRAMRAAGKRAGFGGLRSQNRPEMQRKILGETNKLASEQAELDAIAQHQTNYGVQNFGQMKAARQNVAEDKLLDSRISEELNKQVQYTQKDGTNAVVKLANVEVSPEGLDKLTSLMEEGAQTGNAALTIAAAQRMQISQGGQDRLYNLRNGIAYEDSQNNIQTKNLFGGTDNAVATQDKLNMYSKIAANSKTDDIVKNPSTAYSDTSPSEVAEMSSKRISRQIAYYDRKLPELRAAVAANPGDARAQADLARTEKAAGDFGKSVGSALSTGTLFGRMQPDTKQVIRENSGQSYFSESTRETIRQKVGATTVTSPSINSTATAGTTPGTVNSVGTIDWRAGSGPAASTPSSPQSNAVQVPQASSGTPLVSNTNFGGASNGTTSNTTSNVNNTTQGGGYTPPTAGRQAATSARLVQPNITVETPQQTINLEASEIGHAVGSEIESIANRTARRGGMAPGQVPVIGQHDTYPPGTIIPPDTQSNPGLVDPKVDGQDDEPGDERSVR